MIGVLREAFAPIDTLVVCDLCSDWALADECRDCRAIDPDLSKVCARCVDELSADDDELYGAVPGCAGACGCRNCCG